METKKVVNRLQKRIVFRNEYKDNKCQPSLCIGEIYCKYNSKTDDLQHIILPLIKLIEKGILPDDAVAKIARNFQYNRALIYKVCTTNLGFFSLLEFELNIKHKSLKSVLIQKYPDYAYIIENECNNS